jgi:malate dehydrogenase (oxaloacetate-decarboxylating)
MVSESITEQEALSRIFLVDSHGLVCGNRPGLEPFKRRYAQPRERVGPWQLTRADRITLMDVIRNARPTVLIGTSAQPGAFTKEIAQEMARLCERPIIFPLSNPTSKSEAVPQDLIEWTEGRAIVATGSPFAPVAFRNRIIRIGQCDNSFIFPGVGLGVISSGARRVTKEMFVAAARALAIFSPALRDPDASLYPPLEEVRSVSRQVALAVAAEAQSAGLAEPIAREELERRVDASMWTPRYARYKRKVA